MQLNSFVLPEYMETSLPLWELRNERCRCCNGQGELAFLTCPRCQVTVLICQEIGTLYEITEKKAGKEIGDTIGSTRCFTCGGPLHSEFPPSTAEQIIAFGFSHSDYR